MLPLPGKPPFSTTSSYWLNARDIYQTMRRLGAENPLAIAALANADLESAFNPRANGDSHSAFNLWQWHFVPRGQRILTEYGVDVRTETNPVIVTGALWWEINNTPAYAKALKAMTAAKTGEEAAGIFCERIEGAGAPNAKERRMADAAWWAKAVADHSEFFAVRADP